MIKDLTTLKWKKNIYYVSDGVIFNISPRRKPDLDNCGTYIIDTTPEEISKAKDGTTISLKDYPEVYVGRVPYVKATFINALGDSITRLYPLQYLIEEGDAFIRSTVSQKHPDIFDNKYVHKFNYDIFNHIKNTIKNKHSFDNKNVAAVLTALPDWLTGGKDGRFMTESYIDKYFLKGIHYDSKIATKGGTEETLFQLDVVELFDKEVGYQINFWNEETIKKALRAIYAERIINWYKKGENPSLSVSCMEFMAEAMKDVAYGYNPDNLRTFLNISYDSGDVKFESVCAPDNIDTYFEYIKSKLITDYDYIKDEESWNKSFANGSLKRYYEWSDRVNKPYKEDLWNTVEERAANINDARKDPETGDYVLDENGSYIYDNCERCWLGAVNAPGAKYPWIGISFDEDVHSAIKFKYNYPDGSVKEALPWGNKTFGAGSWGVASVAAEFEDNDFLIPENRKDGGQSTFDTNRFELMLIPAND